MRTQQDQNSRERTRRLWSQLLLTAVVLAAIGVSHFVLYNAFTTTVAVAVVTGALARVLITRMRSHLPPIGGTDAEETHTPETDKER